MQPYRTAKPHAPATCTACAPNGPGHHLCQGPDGCSEVATTQTLRHATQAEYDAIPEGLKPLDGYAVRPVFGCDDCADDGVFSPFCDHTAEPVACPKCQAAGDAACTKKSGKPRNAWHRARYDTQPQPEPCLHAHREDCEVFAGCRCTGDDQAPARTPRGASPTPGPDLSGLTIPVHIAQMVLHQAGFPWTNVIKARSIKTQDNRDAIGAQAYQTGPDGQRVFDEHGHAAVLDVVTPIPLGTPSR